MTRPNLKSAVAQFFDSDSTQYLKYQYLSDSHSIMRLRKDLAKNLFRRHVAPGLHDGFQLLDCGCGPGILQDALAEYPIHYWGVDISEKMLRLATENVGSSSWSGRNLVRADVESLPFGPNSFDAAVSLGVIEYLDNDEALLTEMARTIKPGGLLLIAVTNRHSYNLLFDKFMQWLRTKRLAVAILTRIKQTMGRGKFRQATFAKRRHSPHEFSTKLGRFNFEPIEMRFCGLNALPYPLDHLCGRKLNTVVNALYAKSRLRLVHMLGESYMVLCRSAKVEPAPSFHGERRHERRFASSASSESFGTTGAESDLHLDLGTRSPAQEFALGK